MRLPSGWKDSWWAFRPFGWSITSCFLAFLSARGAASIPGISTSWRLETMTATIVVALVGLIIAAGCGASAGVLLRRSPHVAAWCLGATCLVVLALVAVIVGHVPAGSSGVAAIQL